MVVFYLKKMYFCNERKKLIMKLNLKNPLAFFDLETTGVNIVNDRIVEISIIKILTNGEKKIYTKRVNPTVPIPKQASDVHGILDEDVKDAPTFKEIAKEVAKFIEGADIAGYNSNRFDVPLLAEEFLRAEVDIDMRKRKFIDVQTIFHKMEQRTLVAAYKFYCNKDLTQAHSAEADTMATFEVLEAQLDKYPDLENDVEFLSKFSAQNKNADYAGRIVFNKEGVEVFNFGKYKGQAVEEVFQKDQGYYAWILKSDFALDTKKVLTQIKLRSSLLG